LLSGLVSGIAKVPEFVWVTVTLNTHEYQNKLVKGTCILILYQPGFVLIADVNYTAMAATLNKGAATGMYCDVDERVKGFTIAQS